MKKIKMTVYIIMVLWIVVLTQVIVNSTFKNDTKIIEAFAGANSNVLQSEIQIIADYGDKYLSEDDKKNMIDYLASAVGINTDYEYKLDTRDSSSLTTMTKESVNGKTTIEIISISDTEDNSEKVVGIKQYILFNLEIYENITSIVKYKEMIEDAINKLKVLEYQSTIQFTGIYDGKLSLVEMDKISKNLIKDLNARIVIENKEEELYTIYGYTGLIADYITTSGKRVNINIGINYDEELDQTRIYLATPIINNDY